MSNCLNEQQHESVKHEIKTLKEQCLQICNASGWDADSVTLMSPEEVKERSQCYIQALQMVVQQTETPVTIEEDIIIDRFLSEIKDKNKQLDEVTIFTKAAVKDVQTKIYRLENQIKIADEAKLKPRKNNKAEYIQKAKLKFKALKGHLHNLIESIFPEDCVDIMELMGVLMQEISNGKSSGYIQVTDENFPLIGMLKELNLVKFNPYNKNEVKLDC